MNKQWSDRNKSIQTKLKKQTYKEAIDELIELRNILMEEVLDWKDTIKEEDYWAMPFVNADGYHSKTIAYSLWHIMRIEDIVVNTIIRNEEEVFFKEGFDKSIDSPIITTGNELVKEQIAQFSKQLNLDELFNYALSVKTSTDIWLKGLSFEDLKQCFGEEEKQRVKDLKVISEDQEAIWLIDYWCEKDVIGLIKMPMSRHWIMHIEAANRIKTKLGY